MSVYELSAFTSNNIMYKSNIKYVVEADWYTNDSSITNHNSCASGFLTWVLCYAFEFHT